MKPQGFSISLHHSPPPGDPQILYTARLIYPRINGVAVVEDPPPTFPRSQPPTAGDISGVVPYRLDGHAEVLG